MANQVTLGEWLLENQNAIDFKLREFTWTSGLLPGFSDLEFTLDGETVGRAVDRDPEFALVKAIAEGIERATCKHNGLKSSTGVAAHPMFATASELARLELIERVSFDYHFSRRIPFRKFKSINETSTLASESLAEVGIELSFYQLLSSPDTTVLCAVAEGHNFERPFGGIIGLGCHFQKEEAESSALSEVLINVAFVKQEKNVQQISAESFGNLLEPKPYDRFTLGLCCKYWRDIDFLLKGNSPLKERFPNITISFRELVKPERFSSSPLKVVQASSGYQFDKKGQMPSLVG